MKEHTITMKSEQFKTNETVIQLKNISYIYLGEEKEAINDISLEVKRGEFLVILGHNGSGKSTLAKLINALLLPTRGEVYVCGLSTCNEENIWAIRESAGMVFQNPDNQMVSSIVEEDVAFGPENLKISPKTIRERVDAALSSVGMSEYAQSAPHMLSGGQKQRVAIAGVLAMRPKIVILDEATAMLDPVGRDEIINTMHKLHMEGITVVWITHFMEEAIVADRIVVMESGSVVMTGTPKEIFGRVRELWELGLDIPPVTELANELADAGYDIPRDILTVEEMVEQICQLS